MSANENNNTRNRNISKIVNKTPNFFQSNSQLTCNNNNNERVSKFRRALPQFISVLVNNVLLTVYGMALGFPIVIIPAIQLGKNYRNNDLFLNIEQITWLSTISLTCVPLGAILSGFYCEYIGKKRGLQLVNIPIIISFLLYHFATNADHLYLALGLSSISCGLIETPVILFIAETVESKYRGCLTASGSIFILFGIIFQHYICSILHWRMVAAILTLFPVISIILLCFIPETAIWFIQQNNLVEAIKSLKWFRGWVSENAIEEEFLEIYSRSIKNNTNMEYINKKKRFWNCYKIKLKVLQQKFLWHPFMLILFIFFVGHFSGKTSLRTYTVQIFHALKAPLKKYEATMLLNLCEILGAAFCVSLLQYIGKRKLIFISSIGTAICFLGAGTYACFLYKVPGYSIHNIVSDVAKIPNQNIITIKNITDIFNISFELDTNTEGINLPIQHNFNKFITKNLTHLTVTKAYSEKPAQIKYKNDGNEIKLRKDKLADELLRMFEIEKAQITVGIPKQESNNLLLIPLILLFGAVFFAHIGIKTVPWILIGEILPEEIRNYVAGVTSGFGFFFGFLANYFFLDMLNYLSIAGIFFFYSAVAIYGVIVLYFTLPETENKSLKDIENYFLNNQML